MQWIQKYLVLGLVANSTALYALALHTGQPTEWAVLLASVLTLGVVWVLERQIPFRPGWRRGSGGHQGDWKVDVTSAGVIVGVVDPLLKALAPLLLVRLYAAVGAPLEAGALLAGLSLGAQVLVVLLGAELGKYVAHRLHHRLAPLWWLHAMHHSSTRLYVLNGLRVHPLNHALNFALSVLPLMLLGASPEAIWAYLALTQPVLLLQHANIDLRHSWLNRVFSTPEVHRWHHSTHPQEANSNFGSTLMLWDHLLGTYRAAEGFDKSRQVGLFAASGASYPGSSGYVRQLMSMWQAPCCRV